MRSKYDSIDFDIDYYELLGVDRDELPKGRDVESRRQSCKVLQDAYRLRLFEVHPDRGGDPEVFKSLVRAHSVLSDPNLRDVYDSGKPPEGFEDLGMPIDWARIGKYQRGSLADQVGTTLFLAIVEESGIEGVEAKFAPSDSEFHNYHWEFTVPDGPKEFVLSIVEDEGEVLRLTGGDQSFESSVPFKIYICVPSLKLIVRRLEDEVIVDSLSGEGLFPGRIDGIEYVDADLLSTTDYHHAMEFIRDGGLREAVDRCLSDGADSFVSSSEDAVRDEMTIMSLRSGRKVEQNVLRDKLRELGIEF